MTYPGPIDEETEEELPGEFFEGMLVEGVRQGPGKYVWPDKEEESVKAYYEGNYEDNKKHGKGKMQFPDKSTYEGDWVADEMEGEGTYTYANGDVFKGTFRQGKKHGKGSYLHKATMSQYVGTWEEGEFKGGQWVLVDNSLYTSADATVTAPDVYAADAVEYRPGVFYRAKLTNDLEEFPIRGGKAAALPEPEPPVPAGGEAAA